MWYFDKFPLFIWNIWTHFSIWRKQNKIKECLWTGERTLPLGDWVSSQNSHEDLLQTILCIYVLIFIRPLGCNCWDRTDYILVYGSDWRFNLVFTVTTKIVTITRNKQHWSRTNSQNVVWSVWNIPQAMGIVQDNIGIVTDNCPQNGWESCLRIIFWPQWAKINMEAHYLNMQKQWALK
jgi:hypothetical protein